MGETINNYLTGYLYGSLMYKNVLGSPSGFIHLGTLKTHRGAFS